MGQERLREDLLGQLERGVISFDEARVIVAAKRVAGSGLDAYDAVINGLAPGLREVCRLYDEREYFLPELIMCTDAAAAGLELLRPHILPESLPGRPACTLVLGALEKKVHRLAARILKSAFGLLDCSVIEMEEGRPLEDAEAEILRAAPALVALAPLKNAVASRLRPMARTVLESRPHTVVLLGQGPACSDPEALSSSNADLLAPFSPIREAIGMVVNLRDWLARYPE